MVIVIHRIGERTARFGPFGTDVVAKEWIQGRETAGWLGVFTIESLTTPSEEYPLKTFIVYLQDQKGTMLLVVGKNESEVRSRMLGLTDENFHIRESIAVSFRDSPQAFVVDSKTAERLEE